MAVAALSHIHKYRSINVHSLNYLQSHLKAKAMTAIASTQGLCFCTVETAPQKLLDVIGIPDVTVSACIVAKLNC